MAAKQLYPFFPLGLVAYPGEQINLHIFEPRYVQLFNELNAGDLESFVILPVVDGKLMGMGTVLELEAVAKTYASGEMDVTARGLRPVAVKSFRESLPNKLYAGGHIEAVDFNPLSEDTELTSKLFEQCRELHRALGVDYRMPDPTAPGFSYQIGHRLGLSLTEEYQLLTIPSETERQRFLLKAAARSFETAQKTLEMRRKIQLNGHFRYLKSNF